MATRPFVYGHKQRDTLTDLYSALEPGEIGIVGMAGAVGWRGYNNDFYELTAGLVSNVKSYGAKGDGVRLEDVVTTNSSAVISSAANPWTAADVGKVIVLERAGAGSTNLHTTILSYTSAGQVTIATAASASLTSVVGVFGTDDTDAFQEAIDAGSPLSQYGAPMGVFIPRGFFIINERLDIEDMNIMFRGYRQGTVLKVTAVGTNALASASDYKGFVIKNAQWRFESMIAEGAGSNSGGVLTTSDYNTFITTAPSGKAEVGCVRSAVFDCDIRFFWRALTFRGVNYVVDIAGSYIQWNNYAIHIGQDAAWVTGTVDFTGTNGTVIPAGTILTNTTPNPDQTYTTDSQVTISGGVASVAVTASGGNSTKNYALAAAALLTCAVAGVSTCVVDADGLEAPEHGNSGSNVHFNIHHNTFAENDVGVNGENCGEVNCIGNTSENGIWPPIAALAAASSTSSGIFVFDNTTESICLEQNTMVRPVQIVINSFRGASVSNNIFRSFYALYAILQANSSAVGIKIKNNFIDAVLNTGNDFGICINGIFSSGHADISGNIICRCSKAIDKHTTGGRVCGNTIIDPYASSTGRTHTGEGKGIVFNAITNGSPFCAHNFIYNKDASITSSFGISSEGASSVDVLLGQNHISLTGVADPYDDANGRLKSIPKGATTVSAARTLGRIYPIVFVDCTAGGFTLTLPAAVGNSGFKYEIHRVDTSSNVLVVDANAAETIGGNVSVSLVGNGGKGRLFITGDGSNWRIDNLYDQGTFNLTLTGCTSAPTAATRFSRREQVVTLAIAPVLGTSSSTAATLTGLPTQLQAATGDQTFYAEVGDAGAAAAGQAYLTSGTSTLTLCKGVLPTGFTNTATAKGLNRSLTMTYSLQ